MPQKKEKQMGVHPRKQKQGCPNASHRKRGGEGRAASHGLSSLAWLLFLGAASPGVVPLQGCISHCSDGISGFLGKGEENLASPAPGWVILGVICVFFFNTSFPESVSFPAAELIRE